MMILATSHVHRMSQVIAVLCNLLHYIVTSRNTLVILIWVAAMEPRTSDYYGDVWWGFQRAGRQQGAFPQQPSLTRPHHNS
ncbi:hypothetical protein E2C01_016216 [Portunus trituberculatus]|uniref:Uncharacterized protein n=1 Tax=Portunus trituberculatus TaxID=210409 RepID=A0A5B7DQ05_PORTR|nr:hypothetical protein [Portunus trituberculatus]